MSFTVEAMPEYLYGELDRRARKYGMSFDQFVVAVLSHLAWRTPFAEDLGPWERWAVPDRSETMATVTTLPTGAPSAPEGA